MQIYIKSTNREFKIYCPLFVAKLVLPFVKIDGIDEFRPCFKIIIKNIKRYIRENGHFELVDIESQRFNVKIIV